VFLQGGKEDFGMAVSTAAKTPRAEEAAMRSVAPAMQDAATAASEEPPEGEPPAGDLGADAMRWLSRMTYVGSYALAYGVVYAAVFIAQSLPQENPIMHGFRDGGRAAADQLDDN
jgi:hypothetical protein